MATIAPGLNFRIGADVKGINKAIREAERSLKGAVQSFSNIGNSLSIALSAPIAAFGAISVKAAGQIETLKLALEGTMKGAGRTIEEANMELEALRKAALAPGLDFEQAVRGSVRLQGVGFEAEKARKIIVELANALALSGGSADQLDGVTKQFAQMQAKGKIMQEDLSIILENMPVLASVIKKEFGTATAEGLRAAGVSAEEFISRLTDQMGNLGRAQGGIANAIVNAQNAVQQALASVGEEINKTFNVSGKLTAFSDWITGLAESFKNLDDGTKRLIGGIAVFALTLGPAIKVMQPFVWLSGQLYIGFLNLKKALALSVTEGGIPSLIAKWRAMDAVMKASVIGATIAVVLALGAAFMATSKDMSAAAQAQRAVNEVSKTAAQNIAEEKVKAEQLTAVLKDNNATLVQKKAALNELQQISPKYFGNLDAEKSKVEDIDRALNGYVANLLRAAKAKAAFDQIVEIEKKLQNLGEVAAPTFWQKIGDGIISMGHASQYAAAQGKTLADNMTEQKAVLEAQRTALEQVVKENTDLTTATKSVTAATKEATGAIKEQQEVLKKSDFAKPANFAALPTLATPGEVSPMSDPLKGAADSVKVTTAAMGEYMTIGERLGEINTLITDGVNGVGEAFTRLGETMRAHGQIVAGVAAGVIGSLDGMADAGAGIEEMTGGILASLKKIIGGLIKTGVAAVVTKALLASALNPFAALALGALAGALAQGLFNTIINQVKVPGLAEGGVVSSPSLVMVGEYAGARANPEIVAPERKIRDIFRSEMGSGGGGTLTAVVTGKDLLFVLENAQLDAGRRRGR